MAKIGSLLLTLTLLFPNQTFAHFGVDDSTVIAGTQIDKTVVLGGLILGFIILTVIFQLVSRKKS